MHAEHLTSHTDSPQLQLLPNSDWFAEGGVAPDGQWWVAPTPLFLRQVWHSCVGDDLRKRGFRLRHDGHTLKASQHTVIYLPTGGL